MKNLDVDAIHELSHSQLNNYILPGLQSLLLGATTRLFVNTRPSMGIIVPHSHRFDFQCLVLRGCVSNSLFFESHSGDLFTQSVLTFLGKPGEYETSSFGQKAYEVKTTRFNEGDWYGMKSAEIHSISFSPDAMVLFIEGPQLGDSSVYLEPFIDGETIPLMKTENWMFQRGLK